MSAAPVALSLRGTARLLERRPAADPEKPGKSRWVDVLECLCDHTGRKFCHPDPVA